MAARRQGVGLVYVESSFLLLGILNGSREAQRALENAGSVALSTLTLLEVERALVRAQTVGTAPMDLVTSARADLAAVEDSAAVVPITEGIRRRAGQPFPKEPVRSLDAIHLATALALHQASGPVTVMSTDHRVRDNALALGLDVFPRR